MIRCGPVPSLQRDICCGDSGPTSCAISFIYKCGTSGCAEIYLSVLGFSRLQLFESFLLNPLTFSRRHECRQLYPGLSLSIQHTKRIEDWWTGESPTLQSDWLCQRSNVEKHPTVTLSQKPWTTQSPWLELISMSQISNNFHPGTILHLMASLRYKRKAQAWTSQVLGVEASKHLCWRMSITRVTSNGTWLCLLVCLRGRGHGGCSRQVC